MASKPVLCAGCHYSAGARPRRHRPRGRQVGKPTMSAAMHAYHSDKMLTAAGVPTGGSCLRGRAPPSPETQACYLCHPGKTTQCLRGAMTEPSPARTATAG